MTMRTLSVSVSISALLIAGCTSPTIKNPSSTHLRAENVPAASANLPQPVAQNFSAPKPKATPKAETYSVVVNNVRVHDLLFALARDAKLNVDIHPGINGTVTLNAIDQTLPQLLNRISKQVGMRFEIDGPNLTVMPDDPYLRNYPIDYVNMARDTTGTVSVTTQLMGSGATGSTPAAGAGGANNSTTKIENKSQHHFWESLVQNVKDLLRETDKQVVKNQNDCDNNEQGSQQATNAAVASGSGVAGAGAAAVAGTGTQSVQGQANQARTTSSNRSCRNIEVKEAASVIAHAETGILTVRANSRQHEKIQEFLDKVQGSAKRQVMVEATVVEVELNNSYQQGIQWNRVFSSAAGFALKQIAGTFPTENAGGSTGASFEIDYKSSSGNFGSLITLLDAFGTTKVLSSPKISVLNNQTAVLKVVDNSVYFTIKAETSQNQTQTLRTYTTTLNQVPVGFVMNVTPQISESETILLNVRPSISRVVGRVQDPNPALKASTETGLSKDITSEIPIIRIREMESMLRVQNGNIAVMGGLMEDKLANADSSTPGLSRIPLLGELFTQRNDQVKKTELVIFLRPTIIRDPSLAGDYSNMRSQLPAQDFFTNVPDPARPGDKVNVLRSPQ